MRAGRRHAEAALWRAAKGVSPEVSKRYGQGAASGPRARQEIAKGDFSARDAPVPNKRRLASLSCEGTIF